MTNNNSAVQPENHAIDENPAASSDSPELSRWQTQIIAAEPSYLAVGGMEISEILSATLFRDRAGLPTRSPASDLAEKCHERWAKLADTLTSVPFSTEFLIITSAYSHHSERQTGITILGLGRGENPEEAKREYDQTCNLIWRLLLTHLDYLEVQPITPDSNNQNFFRQAIQFLETDYQLEIRRRLDSIQYFSNLIKF